MTVCHPPHLHTPPLPPPLPLQGIPPQALSRVRGDELRRLIELCITHDPTVRPAARVLLKHPFFESLRLELPHVHSYHHMNGSGPSSRGPRCALCCLPACLPACLCWLDVPVTLPICLSVAVHTCAVFVCVCMHFCGWLGG